MHNVRTDALKASADRAAEDPQGAVLEVQMEGAWQPDEALPQFSAEIKFPEGSTRFDADFPPFMGGLGRAPTPLAYCFYGAMCCYGATFATQAAMEGVPIESLRIRLSLSVDFRTALGLGDHPPMSEFAFEVEVKTSASDGEVAKVKQLADDRCPAIWAMRNLVPHRTEARKV